MKKASTLMLEKGIQNAIPFSRPHPRSKPQTVAENLHGNWNIERGHVKGSCGLALRSVPAPRKLSCLFDRAVFVDISAVVEREHT
jgi:hypothetical protein